ncbi:MAG TPA: SDR family oxidoreductase [Sphingomonadaceae bacterium]|nr:SDR family oxidoreductase [Sphingomonadaceae bacterium]
MGSLSGQVALVTGAGRGFGRAIAMRLASEGAAVALMARDQGQLDGVVAEIAAAGGEALAIAGDVTVAADVDRAVSAAEAGFGPITQFVNNAGVGGPYGPIWEVDVEAWWAAQAVHIRAPMLFLRRILPGMVARNAGRVIIVSARASHVVAPHLSAYCTGKLAQTRIVAEAAAELADTAIKVFAIDPGFVFTALARETMTAPAARKWLPGMVGRLEEMAEHADGDADLARCAQRCVDLFSGRYDALSGRYMELPDDLDAMAREAAAAP